MNGHQVRDTASTSMQASRKRDQKLADVSHHVRGQRRVSIDARSWAPATARKLERCCCQVCLALICRTRGGHLVFALARCVRKSAASSGHLLPISAAKNNQSRSTVALPRLGERALLVSLGLQVCGCSSPASGDTSVVSGVSCAHLKRGRPSATTSSLRPSACTLSKARSRRNTFVETVAPSLHTLVATLPSNTLRDGGHWSHGHTGKRERSEEGRSRNSFNENLEW